MLDAVVIPTRISASDGYYGMQLDIEFQGIFDKDFETDIYVKEMMLSIDLLHPSQERLDELHKLLKSGKKIAILIGEPECPPLDNEEKT